MTEKTAEYFLEALNKLHLERSPCLAISLDRVRENASNFTGTVRRLFGDRTTKIFFAAKSHPSPEIFACVSALKLGCEVISEPQFYKAVTCNMPTIISGFVKSDKLIEMAASSAEYAVIESYGEFERVERLARKGKFLPRVLLRVRLDDESKIGLTRREIERCLGSDLVSILGIHMHPGWNVTDDSVIESYLERFLNVREQLSQSNSECRILNLGGSFAEPAVAPQQLHKRMSLYRQLIGDGNEEIHFEPGRYLVGDAGFLVCRIEQINESSRDLHVNTCAYGYSLNAATPSVGLLSAADGAADLWNLCGLWSAKGDVIRNVKLKGAPKCGASILFRNMGAYIVGLESEFSHDKYFRCRYI